LVFDLKTRKSTNIPFFVAHCIDKYTKLQVEKFQSDGASNVHIDQRLEDIVNRMFQRCFDDKKYKQVRILIFAEIIVFKIDSSRLLVSHLKHVELISLKRPSRKQFVDLIFLFFVLNFFI